MQPKRKIEKAGCTLSRNALSQPIKSLNIDGKELPGSCLANVFNKFFSEVGDSDYNSGFYRFLGDRVAPSMFLEPTDEVEVFAACNSLKDTQSLDSCNVRSLPVKYVLPLIVPCLLYICNFTLTLGHFPVGMQRARVAVIYKNGDKNVPGNYRPISVLPFFSKGLERLFHRKLYSFLLKHSVMVDCQYGFTRNRSMEHALLD